MAIPERRITIKAIFSPARGGVTAEAETREESVLTRLRTAEDGSVRSRRSAKLLAMRGLLGMVTFAGRMKVLVVVVVEDMVKDMRYYGGSVSKPDWKW